MSCKGSHCIAILKVSKANYDELLSGLKDIINKIRDLQCVTVTDTLFKMKYYLGRDIKFLAIVCRVKRATCECSCIWHKCLQAVSTRWNSNLLLAGQTCRN